MNGAYRTISSIKRKLEEGQMKNENLMPGIIANSLLITLVGAIVWASMESHVFIGVDQLISFRWGLATLIDIYIALTFIGVWIGVMENSFVKGIMWTISLYILGNVATLAYFLYRANKTQSFRKIFIP
jgi:hypothetical protein